MNRIPSSSGVISIEFIFQDGFVLVGSVAGQRYWSTLLPPDVNSITSGIWTPDDQHVYLGTSQVQLTFSTFFYKNHITDVRHTNSFDDKTFFANLRYDLVFERSFETFFLWIRRNLIGKHTVYWCVKLQLTRCSSSFIVFTAS